MPYPLILDPSTNFDAEFSAGFITPPGYIDGLELSATGSGTTVNVGAGSAYIPSLGYAINYPGGSVPVGSGTGAHWLHAYLYLNSGTPTVELVTLGPVAYTGSSTGKTKNGDTSRRYLGSVYCPSSSASCNNFMQVGNHVRFLTNSVSMLSGGTATTYTSVSTVSVGACPTTARILDLRALNNDPSVAASLSNADAGTGVTMIAMAAAQSAYTQMPVDATNQQFYYKFNSTPTGNLGLTSLGYIFER